MQQYSGKHNKVQRLPYKLILKDFLILLVDTVNKKCTKQKLLDDDSEETHRVKYKKDVFKCNNSDEAEVCERNNQEQNHSKHSQKKNSENTKQSDWHIESETSYKSVLLNKKTEESLIYKKTCVLSKDVDATLCDKSPSRKSMRRSTKSRKELTSELNSCALKEMPVVSVGCIHFLHTHRVLTVKRVLTYCHRLDMDNSVTRCFLKLLIYLLTQPFGTSM